MILVVGATGLLGSEICRQLADKGKPIRALVRATSDPATLKALEECGAELVQGDLRQRSSLEPACQGITTVITTASTTRSRQEGDTLRTVDLEGQINLVDAAKANDVEHFVYTSYRHLDPHLSCPLSSAKRTVERHLEQSGIPYTILWPGFFMEVWLSPGLGFDYPNASARIYGSGQRKNPWIAVRDVARVAVAALEDPAAQNATVAVGGELRTPLEVVRIFEEVSGRSFAVEHVSEDTLRTQKAEAPDPLQETFAALMLGYAVGGLWDEKAKPQTLSVTLTSVREYAQQAFAAS
jgi:uncharacterized protein YbjT (DUF2867 family)